jgi:quercetin dioxygenase-like cupin family protein
MLKKHYKDVENKEATLLDGSPVPNVFVRWLVDKNDGAKNYAMRRFEIKAGGEVPLHSHPEDHEIYVLQGKGKFINDQGKEESGAPGDVFYIPPLEKHTIINVGNDDFVFLCVIPYLKK